MEGLNKQLAFQVSLANWTQGLLAQKKKQNPTEITKEYMYIQNK